MGRTHTELPDWHQLAKHYCFYEWLDHRTQAASMVWGKAKEQLKLATRCIAS